MIRAAITVTARSGWLQHATAFSLTVNWCIPAVGLRQTGPDRLRPLPSNPLTPCRLPFNRGFRHSLFWLWVDRGVRLG